MKVTFVYPNTADGHVSDVMEPLVFAVLARLTPPDVELSLVDDRKEGEVPYDEPTDLVAMTVETFAARRAYQIASAYRARGVKVVMGGYHPSFLPDEALQYADAVVVGDAEGVWERVLEDARHDRLERVYRQAETHSLANLTPDRRIFQGKGYTPIKPVQFSRGCRFVCEFCSIYAFYGKNVRHRPVNEVVAEIEALDSEMVLFVDDNLFLNVEKAEELFRALKPLKRRWGCQISLDVAKNGALLDLMRESGCVGALVGFESLDPRNLAQMRKKWNDPVRNYEKGIQAFRERGILIHGSFVMGYDHDTTEAFSRTLEFAIRSKFLLANFMPAYPMPGAHLYDRFKKDGRLLHDTWWLHPRYRQGKAMFRPTAMSPDDLEEGCAWARREFYGHRSIWRRALEPKANAQSPFHFGFFVGLNYLIRSHVRLGRDF
ncbi:MAG: B12-binding domain-containing radical SAM protein [Deltaproteobacteria bacterium]|nr:B12-binding domain-containing radical SAM protein [Deltaproteobacteria bacterium]